MLNDNTVGSGGECDRIGIAVCGPSLPCPRVAWHGTAHTATPVGLVGRWIQGCQFGPVPSQECADTSLRRLYRKEDGMTTAIGIDPHPGHHAAAALDSRGEVRGVREFPKGIIYQITPDFTMRAPRHSRATFLCSCQTPRQIPARARSTNDYRPSCTARRTGHFHPLAWPSQGHGDSRESGNPSPERRIVMVPNQPAMPPIHIRQRITAKRS